jgi:aspartyl-tRNA synthetase
MIQSRTHNCNELRIGNVGERVTLVGWFENMRKVSKNLGFVILRDFYGTTQLVVETEEMMNVMDGINKESTISVEGVVRERSSKNANLPTGEIEVVPDKIEILGKCIYNALPFEINQSKDADENARLKYRYLDLRNPNMKKNIVMRSQIVAELRQRIEFHGDYDSYPDLFLSGRSERLSGSRQKSSRQVLRSAPGTPAVQADPDGIRF